MTETVDPESRQAGRRVCAVELARLEERLQPLRRRGADLLEGELQVVLGQLRLTFQPAQVAVAAQDRRPLDLEVDVAGAEFDGASEHEFEIHRQPSNRPAGAPALAGIPRTGCCLEPSAHPCGVCDETTGAWQRQY